MIYLDSNATTRPEAAVVRAVRDAMESLWANPSSVHRAGQGARHAIELARAQVGALIGAKARSITFTSGGTESIDLAIRGWLGARAGQGVDDGPPVIASTRAEHAAVRELLEHLDKTGRARARWLAIDGHGRVQTDGLDGALAGVGLVSVQWANNETGVIQPMAQVSAACRRAGAQLHCDATQWVGKLPVDVGELEERADAGPQIEAASRIDCDLLTFSAHKFHGPTGVGVLWRRTGAGGVGVGGAVGLVPTLIGTQERGRRGGTEHAPGIIGAGVAAQLAQAWLADPGARAQQEALRDGFERQVLALCPGSLAHAQGVARLWNTASIAFPRLEAEAILLGLSERGVCASAGAACSSGSLEPSPVLLAMGIAPELAHGTVRFSIDRHTTADELAEAAQTVARVVRAMT